MVYPWRVSAAHGASRTSTEFAIHLETLARADLIILPTALGLARVSCRTIREITRSPLDLTVGRQTDLALFQVLTAHEGRMVILLGGPGRFDFYHACDGRTPLSKTINSGVYRVHFAARGHFFVGERWGH